MFRLLGKRRALAGALISVGIAVTTMGTGNALARGSGRGAPIKLMAFAPVNTAVSTDPGLWAGAKAAAAAANKAGGINGRKIQVLTCNTQDDPNQTEACARKAIQDHVVAVVGERDLFSTLAIPILAQAGIPDVGVFSAGNQLDSTSPDAFPLVSGDPGEYSGLALLAKRLGKRRLAGVVADTPGAIADAKAAQAVASQVGVTYVGTVLVPLSGVTDYSPYAEQLKNLNAQAVVSVMTPASVIGMLKATQSLGDSYQWMNVPEAFGPYQADQASGLGEGMAETSPFPAVSSTSYPLIKAFDAQMRATGINPVTAPAAKYPFWVTGINSWLSVWGVAKVGATVSGTLTARSLKAKLSRTKSVALPGGFEWNPSAKGPEGYSRVSNWTLYALRIHDSRMTTLSIKPFNVESYVDGSGS